MGDLRRGKTVIIDNDLGHVLRLTCWDDDHLTVEIHSDDEGNALRFEAEFGTAGHVEDLRELFSDAAPRGSWLAPYATLSSYVRHSDHTHEEDS